MKKVITYGTFDTLHHGHILLLQRARMLGDHLTVGLSSDSFNATKNKISHFDFDQRKSLLSAISYVDCIISEDTWQQKSTDIVELNIDIFTMGGDWVGEFDFLNAFCEVIYLPRTPYISSTSIKSIL